MADGTTVSRATVEAIALSYRQLDELRRQQSLTQAKMIRACLAAIRQTTNQAQRSLERERRNHPNPHKRHVRMHEPGKKVREDRLRAELYLEALATMLENVGGLDVKPLPPSL